MALTKVSGEVITRPLVLTGNASVSGIMTVGTGSTTTTIDGSQDFPTIRPTLDLNFAATKTLDRRITFTRDSIGTYTDEFGIIQTVPNNVPRFDHDPVTGESLGLLIEESRTNLLLRSEEFDNASWTAPAAAAAVTTNAGTAPNGTTTADLIAGVSAAADQIYQTVTVANTTEYTLSYFIKSVDATSTRIGLFSPPSTWLANVDIAWTAGIPSTGSTSGSPTNITYTNFGDGWYRCSFTTTTATTSYQIHFHPDRTNSQKTALLWGAQLEQGSFPTSYIPTSGSTVTRAVEYGHTSNMDFYNQSEGSVFSEVKLLDVGNTVGKVIWSLNQAGGFGEGIYMVNESGGSSLAFNLFYGGSNLAGKGTTNITTGTYYKTIYSFETNNVNLGYFGNIGTDDTSATLPTIGRLVIGNNAWGNSFGGSNQLNPGNCHIKSFAYYNKRLTNAQLQSLTRQ